MSTNFNLADVSQLEISKNNSQHEYHSPPGIFKSISSYMLARLMIQCDLQLANRISSQCFHRPEWKFVIFFVKCSMLGFLARRLAALCFFVLSSYSQDICQLLFLGSRVDVFACTTNWNFRFLLLPFSAGFWWFKNLSKQLKIHRPPHVTIEIPSGKIPIFLIFWLLLSLLIACPSVIGHHIFRWFSPFIIPSALPTVTSLDGHSTSQMVANTTRLAWWTQINRAAPFAGSCHMEGGGGGWQRVN